jgi:Cse1
MKYFKNLLYWEEVKNFFTESIESIVNNIILRMEKPTSINQFFKLTLSEEDAELFESEPEGFLENVFNNAGGSSKKNICHDLAKALTKRFKNECTPILQNLV